MNTKAKRKASPAKVRPAARAMAGLREALAHAKGELSNVVVHIPKDIDVRAIRDGQGLTQNAFAARYGLDVSALRDWEQGRRVPDRAARQFLKVIAREPKAVRRALAAE
jgi:putative transcriptional regulator